MTAPFDPMSRSRDEWSPWAPAIWTTLSLILFAASSMAIFIVNALPGMAEAPGPLVWIAWPLLWGGLALTGVILAGRVAFGRWLRVTAAAVVVAGIGIALSVIVNVTLHQWAVDRFGYFDSDLIWWTSGLFAVLVGLATSAFGVFVAPRGTHAWPLSFVLLGAAVVVWIVLGNQPGLGDGIAPESWPLAIWIGISGVYAALVAIGCAVRTRRPAAT